MYPDKLVDVTDVANYLGNKYGGWYTRREAYGMHGKKWVGVPLGVAGARIVYRDSHVKAAGFDAVPRDLAGFLKLCQALKAKGTPSGFALGNATGDHLDALAVGRTAASWSTKNNVVINNPETIAALEYVEAALPDVRPRHAVVARPEQQQGVPRRQISLTSERHLGL